MSDNINEYEMEAGTSGLFQTCDDPRMLVETVGTSGDGDSKGEKYFAVTADVNEEQEDVCRIVSSQDKLNGDNLTRENRRWHLICRICANSSDHLLPIFKGEGLEHEFNNKIQRYLPIQVSEEDNLPLHLCYHCAATLLAWHELADGCLEAEQRLLQMQNEFEEKNQSNVAGRSVDEKSSAVSEESTSLSNKNETPEADRLVVKGERNEESTADDNERYANYIPSSPSTSFTKFRMAYQALLRSSRKEVEPVCQSVLRDAKNDRWLNVDTSDNRNDLDRSNPLNTSDKSQEPKDDQLTSIIVNVGIKNSIISTAFREAIFIKTDESLIEVDAGFENNCQVKEAGEEVAAVSTKTTSYDCKLCNKKFQSEDIYRAHADTHADTKRYTCHICGKQFGQTGSLYYHLKHVHGGVKQHSCDICGRSFAMKAAMEDHRRIHTGERPYCCASCGKTFKTKASLYIHSKTHTDELPHKCSYCPKAFRWRQQMLGHLTIHTGQKNHICEICGKRFGVKNDLTRHKRIHSEEKPFSCEQCGLSFGQKRYLKNHERTRHR